MKEIVKEINYLAKKIDRKITIMELCGTHAESIAKFGIKNLLPKNVKLLSGPGCPVCVTAQRDIDAVISLALKGIPIACYGDVLRVPGTLQTKNTNSRKRRSFSQTLSLDKAREIGADITEVYSVEDALKLQKRKPNLVFFGIGFETTAPMTASAIKRGLVVYSTHKAFVSAMQALIDTPTLKIDGFINPGHVSTIIGTEPYKKLRLHKSRSESSPQKRLKTAASQGPKSNRRSIPQVIAGFEAEDILVAIHMLLRQISEGRSEVENEYTRCVLPEGNPVAMKLINEVFEAEDAIWRGFGKIPNSGFEIKRKYFHLDAKIKYKNILNSISAKPKHQKTLGAAAGCICGAILRGLAEPKDCRLFNRKCTPENPIGACMVSREGACGIAARFGK